MRVEKHEVEVSYQRKINEQQEVYNTLMLQFEDLKDVYEYHYFRIYLREDRQNS